MIAVDAMGGDAAPGVVVAGALRAAQAKIPILLCGFDDQIQAVLDSLDPQWRSLPITIEPCTEAIEMAEEPSRAVVRKKDASLVRAAQAVREGRAQALVSAGNSGAALAASVLIIGRVPGVLRPALGNSIPTPHGSIFCLDLGATTDCRPEYLEQFAYFGSAYINTLKNIASPRVALLSNGHEPYKGSQIVKETYKRLEYNRHINFVGNLESRDLFEGKADVLVMDGFAGNVLLKGIQGTVKVIFSWIKKETQKSWLKKVAALCAQPLFTAIKNSTDYQKVGGALLLGIKKPVVVAHGSSQADAIYNSIVFAHTTVTSGHFASFNTILQTILVNVSSTLADQMVTTSEQHHQL